MYQYILSICIFKSYECLCLQSMALRTDYKESMSVKEKVGKLKHPIVLAFGNPLLDVFVVNNDERVGDLLNKYNLKVDGQAELDREEMDRLFDDLPSGSKRSVCAGGSALNTIRILQQLCGRENGPKICVYYGGIGHDDRSDTLRGLVESANIDARYAVHPSLPTGICLSIISNTCRSLVANLGAAGFYSLDHLEILTEPLPLDSAKIIYIEGFFVTHSLDVAKEVVKRAQGMGITIAFNLNGTYIFKEHSDEICEMVGLANIIFGNTGEMIALAKSLDLQYTNSAEIPFILNNLKGVTVNASNSASHDHWLVRHDNIVVMTQGGSNPATVVWDQGNHASCNPIKPKVPIKDTTGAGDALVSGFLIGLITGQDPETCLRWGCEVSAEVITNFGATMNKDIIAARDILL